MSASAAAMLPSRSAVQLRGGQQPYQQPILGGSA
jgi:hypothetical protein